MFDRLAKVRPSQVHAIDSTTIKAHRCSAGWKGAEIQPIGLSRGGRTTKIHAVVAPGA